MLVSRLVSRVNPLAGLLVMGRFDRIVTPLFQPKKRRAYKDLSRRASGVPRTFEDKVRVKMAFDRDPLLHVFADKVAVRAFVEEKIGKNYLPKLLAVATRAEDIDWSSLPEEFVAKVSHGSGGVVVVSKSVSLREKLPLQSKSVGWERFAVHPDAIAMESLVGLASHWLSLPYAWWPGRTPEWAYEGNARRILIEELIDADTGVLPMDVKVFVFNGTAQVIRIQVPHESGQVRLGYYDLDWNLLPAQFHDSAHLYPLPEATLPKPDNLADIIRIAEKLGGDVDFVRVDLYNSTRGILVGELTNYPTAGAGFHEPASFDEWLGKDWHPSYPRASRSRH